MPDTTPNYDLVRTRLIRTRKKEGWSLRDVAEKTDLSAATLSRFEKNKSTPDLQTLAILADLLNLDRAVLFNTREEQATDTPTLVAAHLRADKNLDPKTAEALANSFNELYRNFAGDAAG